MTFIASFIATLTRFITYVTIPYSAVVTLINFSIFMRLIAYFAWSSTLIHEMVNTATTYNQKILPSEI